MCVGNDSDLDSEEHETYKAKWTPYENGLNKRSPNLFFKYFFLEFGITLPTLDDLPRSKLFYLDSGEDETYKTKMDTIRLLGARNLSKKFNLDRSPKIGQVKVIPNLRKNN